VRQGFSRGWAAFARVGRSFRIATLDEIYGQFSGPLFDPQVTFLQPQTSNDADLGAEWRGPRGSFRADLYQMRLKNEISFNPFTFENVNLDPTRRYGLELDGTWRPAPAFEIGMSYAYTVARFEEGNQAGIDLSGKTVPLVPRHRASAWLSKQWRRGTQVTVDAIYVGEQYFDNDQTNTFVERMPSYTVVDLRIAQRAGPVKLTFSVENLTGEKYFTYGVRSLNPETPTLFNAYPAPERAFFLTADYQLGR
jgi:iron complex outermembrane receptor protein